MEEDETRSFRSTVLEVLPETFIQEYCCQIQIFFFQAAHEEILTKPLSCKDSGGLVKSIET